VGGIGSMILRKSKGGLEKNCLEDHLPLLQSNAVAVLIGSQESRWWMLEMLKRRTVQIWLCFEVLDGVENCS